MKPSVDHATNIQRSPELGRPNMVNGFTPDFIGAIQRLITIPSNNPWKVDNIPQVHKVAPKLFPNKRERGGINYREHPMAATGDVRNEDVNNLGMSRDNFYLDTGVILE